MGRTRRSVYGSISIISPLLQTIIGVPYWRAVATTVSAADVNQSLLTNVASYRLGILISFLCVLLPFFDCIRVNSESMNQNDRFPTTQWSCVLRAGDIDSSGQAALEQLCKDYWYPLYAFARRRGLDPDAACDLVQGFLADFIERRDFSKADPVHGKFRSFLRTSCSNYLARTKEHEHALKRGGGRHIVSIDLRDTEGRYLNEPMHEISAERLFERQWALELLQHVLSRFEAESLNAGNAELFAQIRPFLEGGDRSETYREIAARLEMSEGAFKVAVLRYRRRYRDLLRDEVARTVADPTDVDSEISELLKALA